MEQVTNICYSQFLWMYKEYAQNDEVAAEVAVPLVHYLYQSSYWHAGLPGDLKIGRVKVLFAKDLLIHD